MRATWTTYDCYIIRYDLCIIYLKLFLGTQHSILVTLSPQLRTLISGGSTEHLYLVNSYIQSPDSSITFLIRIYSYI